MKTEFIAHINENTGAEQSVAAHCENTAERAAQFSIEPLRDVVYAAGLLHDIGKYQPAFQAHIKGKDIRVEHSVCGAKVAGEKYENALALLLQYCIAGHHSGLPDGGNRAVDTADMATLSGRLNRETEDFSAYEQEITLPAIDMDAFHTFLLCNCTSRQQLYEKFAFVTRYCFSCLTDADSLDTAEFCGAPPNRELTADFKDCLQRLDAKLQGFPARTPLQKARAVLQAQVYQKAGADANIFLMNMPTGSGKTLCSMKFALQRAIKFHKRRIIYIIPYNSIIDQTAAEFENLFGDCATVLRHQSSFSYDDLDIEEDYRVQLKSSAENWNAQIIITTAVQFFESVYANRRGKLRKLHNTADSILIFDEAHLMPVDFLQPCLQAVTHITDTLNSEAVFLTATMPNFEKLLQTYAPPSGKIVNLITDYTPFAAFQKCSYINLGAISEETLLQKALQSPSTLVVVNTKKEAQALYTASMSMFKNTYHLSTYMTALDRKRVIEEIKAALTKLEADFPSLQDVPDERKIFVVSTSLIEAGVDLDFCSVFRQLAGLDNLLQTGGRCNREGKRQNAEAFVFTFEHEAGKITKNIRAEITKGLLTEFSDITSAECIDAYFERLFFLNKDKITQHRITNTCEDFHALPFATYARDFQLIKSDAVSLVVPRDTDCAALLSELRVKGFTNYRALQKYTCSIYESELADLQSQGAVENLNGVWCLTNRGYYDANFGIRFEATDYFIE